jgi:hypothetical protein
MNGLKRGIASAILIVAIGAFLQAVAVRADGNVRLVDDDCGWVCKNLKQDWNYLAHPSLINQCTPRRLEIDYRLVEESRKAFTRDNPFLRRYCGSPFSTPLAPAK